MKCFSRCLFTIFITSWLATAASAEDGWSWSALNPFGRESTPGVGAGASVGDEQPDRALSLPWSGRQKPSTARSGRPRFPLWSRMNRNTKAFFGKAKDVLTPWDEDDQLGTPGPLGYRTARKTSEEESSFFGSLFEPEPEEEMTVQKFLEMPRVQP